MALSATHFHAFAHVTGAPVCRDVGPLALALTWRLTLPHSGHFLRSCSSGQRGCDPLGFRLLYRSGWQSVVVAVSLQGPDDTLCSIGVWEPGVLSQVARWFRLPEALGVAGGERLPCSAGQQASRPASAATPSFLRGLQAKPTAFSCETPTPSQWERGLSGFASNN